MDDYEAEKKITSFYDAESAYEYDQDMAGGYYLGENESQLLDEIVVTYRQEIDFIPRITASEERELGKDILRLQHICSLSKKECVLNNVSLSSLDIMLNSMKEISQAHELTRCLKSYAGLDELGDIPIENIERKAQMTDVYKLIFMRSQSEKLEQPHLAIAKHDSEKRCCLGDLFGYILREVMENVAFGSGNPELVNSISRKLACEPSDLKSKLIRLAVNIELLPSDLLDVANRDMPLIELINFVKKPVIIKYLKKKLPNYTSMIDTMKINGEKALRRLVESHLWLVVNVAQKYDDRGLSVADLIQEGNIGLLKTAEKYNPRAGTRFMQYAFFWIHQRILRAIADQSRTIRIPVHMTQIMDEMLAVSELLGHKLGRQPTWEEIGHEMRITTEYVRRIQGFLRFESPISLESPVSEEEPIYWDDIIEDPDTLSPEDVICQQGLSEQIEDLLNELTPRQKRVLQLRFGLEDGRSRTLEEAGREFGVTRERIRQIEEAALKRLRHPKRSRKLR